MTFDSLLPQHFGHARANNMTYNLDIQKLNIAAKALDFAFLAALLISNLWLIIRFIRVPRWASRGRLALKLSLGAVGIFLALFPYILALMGDFQASDTSSNCIVLLAGSFLFHLAPFTYGVSLMVLGIDILARQKNPPSDLPQPRTPFRVFNRVFLVGAPWFLTLAVACPLLISKIDLGVCKFTKEGMANAILACNVLPPCWAFLFSVMVMRVMRKRTRSSETTPRPTSWTDRSRPNNDSTSIGSNDLLWDLRADLLDADPLFNGRREIYRPHTTGGYSTNFEESPWYQRARQSQQRTSHDSESRLETRNTQRSRNEVQRPYNTGRHYHPIDIYNIQNDDDFVGPWLSPVGGGPSSDDAGFSSVLLYETNTLLISSLVLMLCSMSWAGYSLYEILTHLHVQTLSRAVISITSFYISQLIPVLVPLLWIHRVKHELNLDNNESNTINNDNDHDEGSENN